MIPDNKIPGKRRKWVLNAAKIITIGYSHAGGHWFESSCNLVTSKKFMISSTLYLETRFFNDNYSICRIYVFSVHLGNGPLKFLILGTQQEIRQMYDSYTFDISSGQFIHGHNVLGIVVFDFQQVYDFPVRGVG